MNLGKAAPNHPRLGAATQADCEDQSISDPDLVDRHAASRSQFPTEKSRLGAASAVNQAVSLQRRILPASGTGTGAQ